RSDTCVKGIIPSLEAPGRVAVGASKERNSIDLTNDYTKTSIPSVETAVACRTTTLRPHLATCHRFRAAARNRNVEQPVRDMSPRATTDSLCLSGRILRAGNWSPRFLRIGHRN